MQLHRPTTSERPEIVDPHLQPTVMARFMA
jgi:hypothetical protein